MVCITAVFMLEVVKRLDAMHEYAVVHNDESEADRLRDEMRYGWKGMNNATA